jgi:hypothetical protein
LLVRIQSPDWNTGRFFIDATAGGADVAINRKRASACRTGNSADGGKKSSLIPSPFLARTASVAM